MTYTEDFKRRIMLRWMQATNNTQTPLVFLIKAPFVPDAVAVLGDVPFADFNGYANAKYQWFTPYKREDGLWVVNGQSMDFVATDGLIVNTIYGFGIFGSGPLAFLWGTELLPVPIVIDRADAGLTIDVTLPYPGGPS
jgi:hypothetical protein